VSDVRHVKSRQKFVTYWCRGCKSEVHRRLATASLVYESWCNEAGKPIRMDRKHWEYAT
jgi:hypothetical protein